MVNLWDAETGQELRTLSGHSGWVNAIAFSPDDQTLASGSCDGQVRLWDVARRGCAIASGARIPEGAASLQAKAAWRGG